MISAKDLLKANGVILHEDVISFQSSPYLFLCQLDSAQKQFQYFTGELKLDEAKLNAFLSNVQFNNQYCSSNSIPYSHIVFPAKIPVFKSLFDKHGIAVNSLFSASHKVDNVHYPFDLLNAEQDFYVQDTHNNDQGRVKLSKFICETLGIKTISDKIIWAESSLVGDMGKRLGREAYKEKSFVKFGEQRNISRTYSTVTALPGNSGQIFFSFNPEAIHKKRLLLFGDSFLNTCQNILSKQIEEVIFLRSPFILPDIADNIAPDFIVSSNAERYLVSAPDARRKIPYFLNYFSNPFISSNFDRSSLDALVALFSGRESHEYRKWKQQKTEVLLSLGQST